MFIFKYEIGMASKCDITSIYYLIKDQGRGINKELHISRDI